MSDDNELEEIRRRKMQELQKQAIDQQKQKEAEDRFQEQKDAIMRKIFLVYRMYGFKGYDFASPDKY